jgi:hypothetical protein
VNDVNINQIPDQNGATEAQLLEDGTANGNGQLNGNENGINIDKNLVNICVNYNDNSQNDGERP